MLSALAKRASSNYTNLTKKDIYVSLFRYNPEMNIESIRQSHISDNLNLK